MTARIGVITFPGTLDDVDAARAIRLAGAQPVELWHADADLQGIDAVIMPGGREGWVSPKYSRVVE